MTEQRPGHGTEGSVIPKVRERLREHYVTAIDCDHETKTDTVRCNCSVWTGTPQPSVGAAVDEWVEHVMGITELDTLERRAEAAEAGLTVLDAALTDEDEIAHAEAWSVELGGLGRCAYCDHDWPCHTQQAIDRVPHEARSLISGTKEPTDG